MDMILVLEWVIKSIILILFGLIGFAYTTYFERRALARIQTRIGPTGLGRQDYSNPWRTGSN